MEGLSAVTEVLADNTAKIKRLKEQGRKIIGYWCALSPVELITAAGAVPYRIGGSVREAQEAADGCIESQMCGFVRGCLDLGLKRRYDFLDGLVVPYCCNSTDTIHSFWERYVKVPSVWVINPPHIVDQPSLNFFRAELMNFKEALEEFSGRDVTERELKEAVKVHNENRRLLREISLLKKEEPPLLTGTEMLEIALATFQLLPEEANVLLRQVLKELSSRDKRPEKKSRLLVYGMTLDDPTMLRLIEECGANVVIGLFCPDVRTYWHQVPETNPPLNGLASHYLAEVVCPRTYEADRRNTLGLARELSKEFGVKGCIAYRLRYCDGFGSDLPDLRDYLRANGIAVLGLEMDYALISVGAARTRIEAFIESLH